MMKYKILLAIGYILCSGAYAQPVAPKNGETPTENDYYFASSNSQNRYFFNRASIHERTDVGPDVKGFQTLWVPLTPPKNHPTLSFIEVYMVADCTQEGKLGLLKASGYDNKGVLVQEDGPNNGFKWMIAPEQTSFNVNWKAACKNIVWPAPARFEGLSAAQVAEKSRKKSVLWNSQPQN